MYYRTIYPSILGNLILVGSSDRLVGLWNEIHRYLNQKLLDSLPIENDLPVFSKVREWLDLYFSGACPKVDPTFLSPQGSPFQRLVWKLLLDIPYGTTTTYGAIASEIARMRGVGHFSAQAVGGAVGRNPISILIPCHRVIGSNGSLTGYGGGLDVKRFLLQHEGVFIHHNTPPKGQRR